MTKPLVRRDLLEVLGELPPMCAAIHPVDNKPVLLKRGVKGFWPANRSLDVDAFNARRGVTRQQREAMLAGSIFGFHVPAADPRNIE